MALSSLSHQPLRFRISFDLRLLKGLLMLVRFLIYVRILSFDDSLVVWICMLQRWDDGGGSSRCSWMTFVRCSIVSRALFGHMTNSFASQTLPTSLMMSKIAESKSQSRSDKFTIEMEIFLTSIFTRISSRGNLRRAGKISPECDLVLFAKSHHVIQCTLREREQSYN